MKEILIENQKIPSFMYGTAWKEDKTKQLVESAIKAGFRSIDTANQRKHYYEAAVGEALGFIYNEMKLVREDIFLQTKYTYQRGQDHRLPYNPEEKYSVQVQQSFQSSLEHLQTKYLDSYLLHGPFTGIDLRDEDWEVWTSIINLHKSGQTKWIGVSNFNYNQLSALITHAEVKPHFVQNRCFAKKHWDRSIRELCKEHNIIYQGFSLLTANIRELNHISIQKIMQNHNCSLAQIVFRFALDIGMLPLTGTTSCSNMSEDLSIFDFSLNEQELNVIENITLQK